jgi:hypothetical protein
MVYYTSLERYFYELFENDNNSKTILGDIRLIMLSQCKRSTKVGRI